MRAPDKEAAENCALYKHRAEVMIEAFRGAGWAMIPPRATMFVWAEIPPAYRSLGAVGFASELLENAGVAVSPGVGFGPGGEGYVRLALIESDDRVRKAAALVGKFLKS